MRHIPGFLSCLILLAVLLAIPLCAAEPAGVQLLRPDSLAGWEYGEQSPAGWTIREGRLHGNSRSTPLLSGFTFSDFVLRFQWSVAGGGELKIAFPVAPSSQGLPVSLREGPGCGAIDNECRKLAPGRELRATADKVHTAEIRRDGEKLTVTVDQQVFSQTPIPRNWRLGLGLAVVAGEATVAGLTVEEPRGQPIFNGKDLDGWWTPGDIKAWAAEDGCLVLRGSGGNYLRTKKDYGNFTLSLEYLIKKGGNSGVGIRTPQAGWPSGDGMELQIMDSPRNAPIDKHSQMAIYGNVPPLARAEKSGEWNRAVIKADGRMISAWVNGELVQHCNTANHPELQHRRFEGWIGIQDHGATIRTRNLYVLEAPNCVSLDAWHASYPLSAQAVLLDRLMNHKLFACKGIPCGAVTKSVAGETVADHVLAELTGPGAVTRIARLGDEGILSFYFDGEKKPRLECKPANLTKALPRLTEDADPAVTCLTYAQGLKIVLRKAKRAEYRIDYVTLPAELAVATFTTPESGFPRGWLSAVDYRRGQYGWGTHREHDYVPRKESPLKKIQPGKAETMLELQGTGTIHWVKLRADKKVLLNNDLWLDVTIDGQPQPAVSTPVRFWFPGLAGQGNYPNFVLVNRGGVTNMLPMPFRSSAVLSLRNCGKKAISNAGLTASVETIVRPEDIPPNLAETLLGTPLHAVFQPAGTPADASGELIRQQGRGRWLGLVYEEQGAGPTAIDAMLVDGKPLAGWASPNFDLFLGRAGDFRACLSGRHEGLAWRYLLLEPVEFQQSLVLKTTGSPGNRLAVFYGTAEK